MTHLLIIESNTPDMVEADRAKGFLPQGDGYAAVMEGLDPSVTCTVREPYAEGSDWFRSADYDGVIFTGSGVAWCVDEPEAAPLQDMMQLALKSGLPIFGSCNGMQLAAHMLGGDVGENPNGREDGIAEDIRKSEVAGDHPMMMGRNTVFSAPCVHRDIVLSLPKGATLIAGNTCTPIQAFAFEDDTVSFWGTQYHPEFTPQTVSRFLADYGYSGQLLDDLNTAETDPAAAERLGTSVKALEFSDRTIELKNWLSHVSARGKSVPQERKQLVS